MKRLIAALKRRPVITSAFVLAVVFMVLFAVRGVVSMVYWSDPDHRDQAIQDWMTPRYVARSWHLPPDVMFTALGETSMPDKRKPLHEIAADRGMSFEELQARIIAAASAYRASQE